MLDPRLEHGELHDRWGLHDAQLLDATRFVSKRRASAELHTNETRARLGLASTDTETIGTGLLVGTRDCKSGRRPRETRRLQADGRGGLNSKKKEESRLGFGFGERNETGITRRLDFTNGDRRRRSRMNGKVRGDATPTTPTDDDDDVQLQWKTETIGGRLQIWKEKKRKKKKKDGGGYGG